MNNPAFRRSVTALLLSIPLTGLAGPPVVRGAQSAGARPVTVQFREWDRPDPMSTGMTYRNVRLTLQPQGTAMFQVRLEVNDSSSGSPCAQITLWDYSSGSFAVQGTHLVFSVQGTRSQTDSCNPARNEYGIPISSTFNFEWEEGIDLNKKTYLWVPNSGIAAPMNNMLMIKQ